MSRKSLVPIQLPADPTQPLEAVTKQYVDARAGSEVEISTTDPIGTSPGAELWYDTDDVSGGVVTPAFDGTPAVVGATGSPGTLNNWARGDHVHAASVYTSYNGPPTAVALATADPGSSTSWARGDHVHSIAPGLTGRNLVDNGQLAIKQRTATTVAAGNQTFLADRWMVYNNGVGVVNVAYNTLAAFGVNLPAGRPRPGNIQSLVVATAEAAGALAAGDFLQWRQGFEGQYLQHLNWGSAAAQPLVYSFDVYSTIATTYVVMLYRYEATARTCCRLLTVPAGFSTQVLTFPGDTTTAITNDNALRLQASIWVVAGSQFSSGTLQTTWGNQVDANMAAGVSNNWAATLNNVFAITNVQLEVGTVATPYEVRRFDDELRSCQRCAFFPNFGQPTGYGGALGVGWAVSATQAIVMGYFPVTMRASPTMVMDGSVASNYVISDRNVSTSLTALVADTLVSPTASAYTATVASGLTAYRPMSLYRNNNTANIGWSAEI